MGVPLLLSWLKRYVGDCFIVGVDAIAAQPQVDNLYIDFNSLLYQAADAVRRNDASAAGDDTYNGGGGGSSSAASASLDELEQAILRMLFDILDNLIMSLCRPRRLVYIAIDGVSPLGKMAEQRARRMSSNRRAQQRGGGGGGGAAFDANAFTCGTAFMEKIALALQHYCVSRCATVNSRRAAEAGAAPDVLSFLINDWTTPGEGEQKIFAAIRSFRTAAAAVAAPDSTSGGTGGPYYSPNTRHCIVSNDTDVIICALPLHEPFVTVLQYDHKAAHDAMLAFSIELFRRFLYKRLGSPADEGTFEKALHDIVFVLLLFGNDFLPKISGVGDVQDGQLDRMVEFVASDFVTRAKTLVDPATALIDFSSAVYLMRHLRGESRAPNAGSGLQVLGAEGAMAWGFDHDATGSDVQKRLQHKARDRAICYWTMLQWAVTYCCTSETPSWLSAYPYASHDVPNLSDLIEHCGIDDSRLLPPNDAPVGVFTQLLLLLPESSTAQLLPASLLREYDSTFKPIMARSAGGAVAAAAGPTITRDTVCAVAAEVARIAVRLTKQEALRHRACDANANASLVEFAVLWEAQPVEMHDALRMTAASKQDDDADEENALVSAATSAAVTASVVQPDGGMPGRVAAPVAAQQALRPASLFSTSNTAGKGPKLFTAQGPLDLFGKGVVRRTAVPLVPVAATAAPAITPASTATAAVAAPATAHDQQPVAASLAPPVEQGPAAAISAPASSAVDAAAVPAATMYRQLTFSGMLEKLDAATAATTSAGGDSSNRSRPRLQGHLSGGSFHLPAALPYLPPVRLTTRYGAVVVGLWSYAATQKAVLLCRPLPGCTAVLTVKRAREVEDSDLLGRAGDGSAGASASGGGSAEQLDEKKLAIRRRIEEMKAQKLREDIHAIRKH